MSNFMNIRPSTVLAMSTPTKQDFSAVSHSSFSSLSILSSLSIILAVLPALLIILLPLAA